MSVCCAFHINTPHAAQLPFLCVARQQEGVQQFLASSNTRQRGTGQHMVSVGREEGRKGREYDIYRIGRNRSHNFGFHERSGVDILISTLAVSL